MPQCLASFPITCYFDIFVWEFLFSQRSWLLNFNFSKFSTLLQRTSYNDCLVFASIIIVFLKLPFGWYYRFRNIVLPIRRYNVYIYFEVTITTLCAYAPPDIRKVLYVVTFMDSLGIVYTYLLCFIHIYRLTLIAIKRISNLSRNGNVIS